MKKNVTTRIGEDFSKELEEIKQERLDKKLDKKKKSIRRLTNLIIKHDAWPKIKKGLLEVNLEDEK